jgi:nucleotide-binding universal stress UspA family protein
MKRILIPIDFSPLSIKAVEVGASIVEKSGGELFLLNVKEDLIESNAEGIQRDGLSMQETVLLMKQIEKSFKELLNEPFLKGLKVRPIFQKGGDFDDIVRNSEKNNMDLIVQGTHGVKGLKERFVGSFAEKIVNLAQCPVLTVKENSPSEFNPKRILFVSNFFTENQAPFVEIKKFADLFGSNFHFLKIVTPGHFQATDITNELMGSFEKEVEIEATAKTTVNAETFEDGVKSYLGNHHIDMVAIETHGKNGLLKFFSPSMAEKLVNHLEYPVLTNRIVAPEIEYGVLFPNT